MVGTAGYIAPELWGFIERGSAFACDIWALGEILFQILTKKPAFSLESLARYKTQQQFPVTKLRDVGVSQQGIDFLLSLMCPYPNDRTTASFALSTVWIQSVIPPQNSTTVCLSLQNQRKEAEAMFRRALQGREKVLGHDHKDTLSSRMYMEVAQMRRP
jgi:serine/threonine protein kinase